MATPSNPSDDVAGLLPSTDLRSALISAGCNLEDATDGENGANSGPYTHYRITKEKREGRDVVLLDKYLLKTAIDTETGDTVEVPHGTVTVYLVGPRRDGAYLDVIHYGG